MKEFINNLIHMAFGEFLIMYWKLYIIMIIVCTIIVYFSYKKEKQKINKKYDDLEKKFKQ